MGLKKQWRLGMALWELEKHLLLELGDRIFRLEARVKTSVYEIDPIYGT
jgi:hypothetical protein